MPETVERPYDTKLVELFEAHGVSFVAVTQQFNTTTLTCAPRAPWRRSALSFTDGRIPETQCIHAGAVRAHSKNETPKKAR
jgi:hypothetical protein